ncbi:MAG: histidinol-phosphatase [Oscillospiraceae bacterium]|nr:histidinol-phosphatase [Oscillospiraceae bacterium]
MKISGSFHNHTLFSDGTESAESMVLAAIGAGLSYIGISDHSPLSMPSASRWWTRSEDMPAYRAELSRLKEKYKGKIHILSGIELDIDSDPKWGEGFDYVIGAVHQLLPSGDYCSVDYTIDEFDRAVNTHFNADPYEYVKAYFDKVRLLAKRDDCPIAAHIDLLCKFNEKYPRFDEESERYLECAAGCMEALTKAGKIIELNTGAITRGWKSVPYPSRAMLKMLREMDGKLMLAADAHAGKDIAGYFYEAAALAKECGFDELWTIDEHGLRPEKL